MKQKTYSHYLTYTAILALSLTLGACGGSDEPLPPPPPQHNPVEVPVPDYGNVVDPSFDYVEKHVIPVMQQQYGNIKILQEIKIIDVHGRQSVIPAGAVLSWRDMYRNHIRPLAATCPSCYIEESQLPPGYNVPSSGFWGWGAIDYGSFHGYLEGGYGYDTWVSQGNIAFERFNVRTSFYAIINILVYVHYDFYNVYYANYIPYHYGTYHWPMYSYYHHWPVPVGYRYDNFISGGLHYNSGGGLSLNIGGFFRF